MNETLEILDVIHASFECSWLLAKILLGLTAASSMLRVAQAVSKYLTEH